MSKSLVSPNTVQNEEQIQQFSDFKSFLGARKQLIEDYLNKILACREASPRLWEAMHYSSLNGGKRLRGILCLTAYEAICQSNNKLVDLAKVLPIAAGIECIHAMSLVHDDLPCMDNDDLRRGKPTCHKAYDEATALLAGDALLVEGIHLCLKADLPAEISKKITSVILEAVGALGMTGGQMVDLENTNKDNVSLAELEEMHKLKTGAFLSASVLVGGLAAEADEKEIQALTIYAESLGLAFQIVDDLLDLESDSTTLGKTAGKDEAQNKTTYPKLLGLAESRLKAENLIVIAKTALEEAKISNPFLYQIADYVLERKY
ncbi:MAG: polyprenyl synthetase family protein [Candidatus Caenarcaniphilales bacterium]|nr:polyprenyl synthetase family protein [Candidatus Caenarcaniphilales bacterium]